MVTEAKRLSYPDRRRGGSERVFASAEPALWPWMLWRRARQVELPYPLNEPGLRYLYSARNGIYALAQLLGLRGEEILFPAYFCGVEVEALLAAGVKLRFFPVRARMRIDPEEVAAAILPQTRAIYLIHYLGFPGPVEEIQRLCRERGLLLIEDCALSLLSCLGERPLGSFGDAAVFCFYKTVPVPNGGALLLHSGRAIELAEGVAPSLVALIPDMALSLLLNFEMRGSHLSRILRQGVRSLGQAVLRLTGSKRATMGLPYFDPAHLGLAMSTLSQTVLRVQDFPAIIAQRRRNYSVLLEHLRELAPPIFEELPPGVCPLFYPLQVPNKPAVQAWLQARGVETVDFWRWGHRLVPPGVFPEVDELRRTILWLPCHQDLTTTAVERMAMIVHEVVKGVR